MFVCVATLATKCTQSCMVRMEMYPAAKPVMVPVVFTCRAHTAVKASLR